MQGVSGEFPRSHVGTRLVRSALRSETSERGISSVLNGLESMAVKIGELLVQNGLITDEQLEEALQAQLVFGGRLGTNLVELGYISTATLAEFLSKQLHMPALSPSALEKVPKAALEAIPPEKAAKYMMFPLSLEKRVLKLAMADPTDLDAVDEIAFSTGYRITTIVAPELLVMYALEKFYDVKRESRFVRIAESMKDVAQATAPGISEAMAAVPGALRLNRADEDQEKFGLREAAATLAHADKHATILSVLRRCMAEDFERVIVFALDGVHARAWGHYGCHIPPEVIRDAIEDPLRSIEIPVELSVLFRHARGKPGVFVDSISDVGADHILVAMLETEPHDSVLIVPVRWGDETVCVAIGAKPRNAGIFEKTGYYKLLGDKLTDAVEIVRLRKRILAV